MLIEIYILLSAISFLFMSIAFIKKDVAVIFAFLSAVLMFSVGIGSFSVEKPFCDLNTTDSVVCTINYYNQGAVSYFYTGFGILMLFYGFIMAFFYVSKPAGENEP